MKAEIKLHNVPLICQFQHKGEEGTTPTDESDLGELISLIYGRSNILYLMCEMGFENDIRIAILETKTFL
jgi:hypothetical protein